MKMTINIKGKLIDLSQPLVMGILNVTPDSFYESSRKQSEIHIIERVQEIISQGGDIIDVGAQSTNPSSEFLTEETERQRLDFALKIINREFPEAIISVDTFYGNIARLCVEEYGAAIINDVSGGQIDNSMFDTIAQLNVPYILMHMRGLPQTMQNYTNYKSLIPDIFYYFSEKIAKLHQMGVNDIIIDPGFGFSKDIEQNYELMAHLSDFNIFELPLLVGISRKSMIYKLLNKVPQDSINGTTVLNTCALLNGANILRVHDVNEAVEVVKIIRQLRKNTKY